MGNTAFGLQLICKAKDHPHIRGEYSSLSLILSNSWGSPPYTWGIRPGAFSFVLLIRITPIYVGNTWHFQKILPAFWDHPHIRGEYFITPASSYPVEGSPPYTWGIHSGTRYYERYRVGSPPYTWGIQSHEGYGRDDLRITPIYVGNTDQPLNGWPFNQDHPHIRGEYATHDEVTEAREGSPPYTWGILSGSKL